MASELKKLVQGLLESQLDLQDPRCTAVAFDRLTGAGFSESKAKDKISQVLMSEIYTSTMEQADFDEKRYARHLRNMVNKALSPDKDASPDAWELLEDHILEGSVADEKKDFAAASTSWLDAWDILKNILRKRAGKPSISGLEKEKNYYYDIGGWLRDIPPVLRRSRRYEDSIQFCEEVLDSFHWNPEDTADPEKDSDTDFRRALGISLFLAGRFEDGKQYFEKWSSEDPDSAAVLDGYAEGLTAIGKYEEAYNLLKDAIGDQACSMKNNELYSRLASLAVTTGHKEEAIRYRKQIRDYISTLSGEDSGASSVFGDGVSADNPIDAFLNGLGGLHP